MAAVTSDVTTEAVGMSVPMAITHGPDGALWFTDEGNNSVGRITTAGVVTMFSGSGIDGPRPVQPVRIVPCRFTNGELNRTHHHERRCLRL